MGQDLSPKTLYMVSLGPRGNAGQQGPQGRQGVQGIQGGTGVIGPGGGFQGWQGWQGPQGWQGDLGNQGVQGDLGGQGRQGNPSPPGIPGPQGNQGNPGSPGTGPQGNQGNTGGGTNTTIQFWSVLGSLASSTTYYAAPGAGLNLIEYKFLAGASVNVKNLYIRVRTPPGGGESVLVTVRKNGADTALFKKVEDAATTAFNIADTVAFVPADELSISAVTSGAAAAEDLTITFTIEA